MKNIIAWILALTLAATLAVTLLFSQTPPDIQDETSSFPPVSYPISSPDESEKPSESSKNEVSSEAVSQDKGPVAADHVTLSDADTKKGNLILVNESHPLSVDLASTLVQFYTKYNNCYKFSTTELYMDADALDGFTDMTAAFTAKTSLTDITLYSAYDSDRTREAAAGLTVTLSIVRSSQILSFYGQDAYSFFYDDGPRYGYVLRYPSEKSDITGVSHKANILRFVGLPHAVIMDERDLVLEEYLELLTKSHTFDSPLNYTDSDNNHYLIYAQKISGSTRVPLPDCKEYTVSGTNTGYVIITAKM